MACAVSLAFSQDILVNEVGYEQSGPKRAVIQSSAAIADSKAYLIDSQGNTAQEINLSSQTSVSGWSGRNFKVADFSDFELSGTYRLKVGSKESSAFKIGKKILQTETGAFQVSFFNGMRHTGSGDSKVRIHGSNPAQYHNIYGGWWDANGDPGKHLSHLSYANYFNPQQIPLVAWALLHASELQPETFSASAKNEAAWGADYLLRSLSTEDYFYMSVFDNWGGWGLGGGAEQREICEWSTDDGTRSPNYQSAMREGGGVSIAALARASKAGISGDSSSAQYLAGAKRAYAHLKANPGKYQNDGIENIIDDYTGLLAASELYNATNDADYCADAASRAGSLLSRQSEEGWFYTTKKSGQNERPFYHAADEGLPVVALVRYVEVCKPANTQAIKEAIKKNFEWYMRITYERANPFEYAKMYGNAASGANPGETDLARGGTATASRSEGSYTPDLAIDGSSSTRWSSYQNGSDNDGQWIMIDLGGSYKVNKVILNWEAAYGKSYRIEVSSNGSDWATVANIAGNTSDGKKEHAFTATDARYVRMFGIERGNEYGGFSLYDFEVYGEQSGPPVTPHNARFFMPHSNETGYWWQGENARIASLSAAFAMGAFVAQSEGFLDTLYGMAYAQLDWILGKNPFKVTMMHGFGTTNYPAYPGLQNLGAIKGGICNGITAQHGNENDLQWSNASDGDNWRWIEQWLPHNAWYLTAIASISHIIDNPIVPQGPEPIMPKNQAMFSIQINQRGSDIYMSSEKDVVWRVHNLQGKLLFSSNSKETRWNAGNFKGSVVISALNGGMAQRKLFTITR